MSGVGILLFALAILFVVMVHETGHFVMAKLFDFKATKFFLGFGPTLWSFTKGETEYGIKAIPAGGFVRIVGMNPYEEIPPEDVPRAYPNKPKWQRAILLVAGSATHWIVAFALLVATGLTLGFPTGDVTTEVSALTTKAPATEAGFHVGDRIVAVGGAPVHSWGQIRGYIRSHPDERASFTIQSGDATKTISVRLGKAVYDKKQQLVEYAGPGEPLQHQRSSYDVVGFLGVQPKPEYKRDSLVAAIGDAGRFTGQATVGSVMGIGQVFGQIFGGELWAALTSSGQRRPDEGPVGLVGASRLVGESFARGQYLDIIALIVGFTIFVGLMNLLPLPPLDGGHLAVVAYEAITGRSVDIRKLIPIAAAVISFFVLLFVAVLYLDIARPIRVPF